MLGGYDGGEILRIQFMDQPVSQCPRYALAKQITKQPRPEACAALRVYPVRRLEFAAKLLDVLGGLAAWALLGELGIHGVFSIYVQFLSGCVHYVHLKK